MDWVLSVSFGELTLKGDNRKNFEDRAIQSPSTPQYCLMHKASS